MESCTFRNHPVGSETYRMDHPVFVSSPVHALKTFNESVSSFRFVFCESMTLDTHGWKPGVITENFVWGSPCIMRPAYRGAAPPGPPAMPGGCNTGGCAPRTPGKLGGCAPKPLGKPGAPPPGPAGDFIYQ